MEDEKEFEIDIDADVSGLICAFAEKGAKQYQEDSWCIYASPNKELLLAAIFDGHGGYNGRVASMICRKLTWEYFDKNWKEALTWSKSDWEKKMVALFDTLHQSIRDKFVKVETAHRIKSQQSEENVLTKGGVIRKSSGYPMHGGTTASVVIAIDTDDTRQCICANVGDSDALLLPVDQRLLEETQKNYMHLSIDHGPDSAAEFMRIKNLPKDEYPKKLMFVYDKAQVRRKYECPQVFLSNGQKDPEFVKNPWGNDLRPTNVRYDPAVYAVSPPGVREDVTCIAMTRSLGDFYAHQFGLTWRPDVQIKKLDKKNDYLITVGSDGIWDCWKFDDFSDFATSTVASFPKNLYKACRHVVRATVERARALFGSRSFDDASACFLRLPKK